jgi:signal transduction histidine kinase
LELNYKGESHINSKFDDVYVRVDIGKIKQVLGNFVSNALKFSKDRIDVYCNLVTCANNFSKQHIVRKQSSDESAAEGQHVGCGWRCGGRRRVYESGESEYVRIDVHDSGPGMSEVRY